jgi:hypothetical protein
MLFIEVRLSNSALALLFIPTSLWLSNTKCGTTYQYQVSVVVMSAYPYRMMLQFLTMTQHDTPFVNSSQTQSPFLDGVFCKPGIISLDPLNTYYKIGVQAQVFVIVNDEDYYYPDLFRGMIVNEALGMGTEITYYTGSTTGQSFNNDDPCSRYTPVSWQVDRKCHVISASSFDKMCAEMISQADDMTADLAPHGSRILVADELASNNHQNMRYRRE